MAFRITPVGPGEETHPDSSSSSPIAVSSSESAASGSAPGPDPSLLPPLSTSSAPPPLLSVLRSQSTLLHVLRSESTAYSAVPPVPAQRQKHPALASQSFHLLPNFPFPAVFHLPPPSDACPTDRPQHFAVVECRVHLQARPEDVLSFLLDSPSWWSASRPPVPSRTSSDSDSSAKLAQPIDPTDQTARTDEGERCSASADVAENSVEQANMYRIRALPDGAGIIVADPACISAPLQLGFDLPDLSRSLLHSSLNCPPDRLSQLLASSPLCRGLLTLKPSPSNAVPPPSPLLTCCSLHVSLHVSLPSPQSLSAYSNSKSRHQTPEAGFVGGTASVILRRGPSVQLLAGFGKEAAADDSTGDGDRDEKHDKDSRCDASLVAEYLRDLRPMHIVARLGEVFRGSASVPCTWRRGNEQEEEGGKLKHGGAASEIAGDFVDHNMRKMEQLFVKAHTAKAEGEENFGQCSDYDAFTTKWKRRVPKGHPRLASSSDVSTFDRLPSSSSVHSPSSPIQIQCRCSVDTSANTLLNFLKDHAVNGHELEAQSELLPLIESSRLDIQKSRAASPTAAFAPRELSAVSGAAGGAEAHAAGSKPQGSPGGRQRNAKVGAQLQNSHTEHHDAAQQGNKYTLHGFANVIKGGRSSVSYSANAREVSGKAKKHKRSSNISGGGGGGATSSSSAQEFAIDEDFDVAVVRRWSTWESVAGGFEGCDAFAFVVAVYDETTMFLLQKQRTLDDRLHEGQTNDYFQVTERRFALALCGEVSQWSAKVSGSNSSPGSSPPVTPLEELGFASRVGTIPSTVFIIKITSPSTSELVAISTCPRSPTSLPLHCEAVRECFLRSKNAVDEEATKYIMNKLVSLDCISIDAGASEHRSFQRGVIARASLLADQFDDPNNGSKSTAFSSNSAFAYMWSKPIEKVDVLYADGSRANKERLMGKSMLVLDTSAEEAAAWAINYCSYGRTDKARKDGAYVRTVIRKNSLLDIIITTIVKLPFPFSPREFVTRMVAARKGETVVVAAESLELRVDNGFNVTPTPVRTFVRGICIFRELPAVPGSIGSIPQCEMSYYSFLNSEGFIPGTVANSSVRLTLGLVHDERAHFQQDTSVDSGSRNAFVKLVSAADHDAVLKPEYEAMVKNVVNYFNLKGRTIVLTSPDKKVKMYAILPGDVGAAKDEQLVGEVILVAETVVDASIGEIAAWEYLKMTRRNIEFRFQSTSLESQMVKVDDHCMIYRTVNDIGIPGFLAREFCMQGIWKWTSDSKLVVAYEDIPTLDMRAHDNAVEPPRKRPDLKDGDLVKGWSNTILMLETLPPLCGSIPQTKVVLKESIDLKGIIPYRIGPLIAVDEMMYASHLREDFDKEHEIMRLKNETLTQQITSTTNRYERTEIDLMLAGNTYFNTFKTMNVRKVKGANRTSPLVRVFETRRNTQGENWFKATVLIRAKPVDALAYMLNFDGGTLRWSSDHGDEVEILENPTKHSTLLHHRGASQHFGRSHDLVTRLLWAERSSGGYMLMGSPAEHNTKPPRKFASHRATHAFAMRISYVGETFSLLSAIHIPNYGSRHLNRHIMFQVVRHLDKARQFFQEKRTLEEFDSKDGLATGEAVMALRTENALRMFFDTHIALKEMNKRHPFFFDMVCAMKRSILFQSSPKIKTNLVHMSKYDGSDIGSALALSLLNNLSPESAIDEWMHTHQCLIELDRILVWIRPFFNVIAKRVLEKSHFGIKLRIFIGALVSLAALSSAIFMCVVYWKTNRRIYALANLIFIGVNIVFQCGVQAALHSDRPKYLTRECFIILSFAKPIVDAYRVAVYSDHSEDYRKIDLMSEFAVTRVLEMVTKGIPSSIVQGIAFVSSSRESPLSFLSLLVSVFSVSYTSACMSYDHDTSIAKRTLHPTFYGYIPSNSNFRTQIFVAMLVVSSAHFFARVMAIAFVLAMTKSSTFLIGAFSLDLGVFFLYKLVRRDFIHWFPLNGKRAYSVTVLIRAAVKILTSMTFLIHFRHSYDLGGAYWLFDMLVVNPVFVLTSTIVYLGRVGDMGVGGEKETGYTASAWAQLVWIGLISTCVLWVISVTIFFKSIDKRYYPTFYSLKRGFETTIDSFRSSEERTKAEVFRRHHLHWISIREEVKAWTMKNFSRWNRERPDWFTPVFLYLVPDDFLPEEERIRMSKTTIAADYAVGVGVDSNKSHASMRLLLLEASKRQSNSRAAAFRKSATDDDRELFDEDDYFMEEQ